MGHNILHLDNIAAANILAINRKFGAYLHQVKFLKLIVFAIKLFYLLSYGEGFLHFSFPLEVKPPNVDIIFISLLFLYELFKNL